MSERPFMQLYVSDYLGDTRHLSCEQHGAYLLLLMTMWNAGGSLPDDDAKLARIVCLSVKKWRAIRDDVFPFFDLSDGRVTHHRLTKELQKSEAKSQSRASAGAEGGRAKALKDKETRLANAMPELQHLPDTRDHKRKEEPSGSSKKRAGRLPEDWKPDLSFAASLGLSEAQAANEAQKFREWWPAQPGQKGVKLDWDLTWKTWCRKAVESRPMQRGGAPPQRLTQGESLRNMGREKGVIDDTGNPVRRLEVGNRDRENSGAGDPLRLAFSSNLGW